jgi:hypothetical protein
VQSRDGISELNCCKQASLTMSAVSSKLRAHLGHALREERHR